MLYFQNAETAPSTTSSSRLERKGGGGVHLTVRTVVGMNAAREQALLAAFGQGTFLGFQAGMTTAGK